MPYTVLRKYPGTIDRGTEHPAGAYRPLYAEFDKDGTSEYIQGQNQAEKVENIGRKRKKQ